MLFRSPYVQALEAVAITPGARLWIFTDQGAFTSNDGRGWEHVIAGVPARNLRAVTYDIAGHRLLGAATNSGEIFASDDDGRTWTRLADSGWSIRSLIVTPGRLFAATPFSGIVAPAERDAAALEVHRQVSERYRENYRHQVVRHAEMFAAA